MCRGVVTLAHRARLDGRGGEKTVVGGAEEVALLIQPKVSEAILGASYLKLNIVNHENFVHHNTETTNESSLLTLQIQSAIYSYTTCKESVEAIILR